MSKILARVNKLLITDSGYIVAKISDIGVLFGCPEFEIKQGFVGFKHTIEAVRWLYQHYPAIAHHAPIQYDGYTFPAKFPPRTDQKITASFLTTHKRAFCTSEMGVGKTIAALWAADWLLTHGHTQRFLIISPLFTLRSVWQREIETHLPHRTITVLTGSAQQKRELLKTPCDFLIVNFDGVRWILNELLRYAPTSVIIDEVSEIRHHTTAKWKAINHVVNTTEKDFVWALTGTPIPNNPLDAFGQIKIVFPHRVQAYYKFRTEYAFKATQFRWVIRPGAISAISGMFQPCIRYMRSQCYELPPVSYADRLIPLTKEQDRVVSEIKRSAISEMEDGKITAANEAIVLSKILQICSGAVYGSDGGVIYFRNKDKIEALLALVRESVGKVVIFVPYIAAVKLVSDQVRWDGHPTAVIYGATPEKERYRIIHDFQNTESPRVLVAHPQTLSHGVTLTAASTMIWYTAMRSGNIYGQACDRIQRSGQVNPQLIVHMYSTKLELDIFKRLKNKQETQGVLLDFLMDRSGD